MTRLQRAVAATALAETLVTPARLEKIIEKVQAQRKRGKAGEVLSVRARDIRAVTEAMFVEVAGDFQKGEMRAMEARAIAGRARALFKARCERLDKMDILAAAISGSSQG